MQNFRIRSAAAAAALVVSVAACGDNGPSEDNGGNGRPFTFQNRSVTPVLARSSEPGVGIFSLISSDDTLPQSPNFIFGGSADGAGLVRANDGTYTLLVNHEDNFAVSRITLDSTFRPVRGEYVLNSTFGLYRLCSATMATPEEHGFGPLYLTAGESGPESQTIAVDPFGAINSGRPVAGFGQWSAENTVPLPLTAYRNRTAVIIGDDDSGTDGGQIALYLSNTVGDLTNGNLYVLTLDNGTTVERTMQLGSRYPVTFRQIPDQRTLRAGGLNADARTLGAMQFGRVEDLDYRKDGVGREIYFNVTGQATSGANATFTRTRNGRVYKLVMDARDPLKGTLEVILDGDDRSGPARFFQNVDNIVATENYLYIQEDPNSYGDETHDAYIYQYDLRTQAIKPVVELDHRRTATDAAKYNVGGPSRLGSWEYGAMIDIGSQLRLPSSQTAFLVSLQPHTWTGPRYQGVDGGTLRPTENQASQMVIITGLPK